MAEYGLDGGQVAFMVVTLLVATGLMWLNAKVDKLAREEQEEDEDGR